MAELGYQEGRNFTFDYIQTPDVEGWDSTHCGPIREFAHGLWRTRMRERAMPP
jgi:hypothetical protein